MTIQEQENRWNTPKEIAEKIMEMAQDFDTDTEEAEHEKQLIIEELTELGKKGSALYYALRFITTE